MSDRARWKRVGVRILLVFAGLGLLIQFVPYGRRHDNPRGGREPAWDTARTRDLVRRACYDCHSNEVRWPWYSHVAPVSWLVQRDVDQGRRRLNFSEGDRRPKRAKHAAKEAAEGTMPPWPYRISHPEAQFTLAERFDLVRGLRNTFGEE